MVKLNEKLLEKQGVSAEATSELLKVYERLDEVLTSSYQTGDIPTLKKIAEEIEQIEFELQRLWNFPQDANYHSYWFRINRCTCPRHDNVDPMFFGGGKIIMGNCPIHGRDIA